MIKTYAALPEVPAVLFLTDAENRALQAFCRF